MRLPKLIIALVVVAVVDYGIGYFLAATYHHAESHKIIGVVVGGVASVCTGFAFQAHKKTDELYYAKLDPEIVDRIRKVIAPRQARLLIKMAIGFFSGLATAFVAAMLAKTTPSGVVAIVYGTGALAVVSVGLIVYEWHHLSRFLQQLTVEWENEVKRQKFCREVGAC